MRIRSRTCLSLLGLAAATLVGQEAAVAAPPATGPTVTPPPVQHPSLLRYPSAWTAADALVVNGQLDQPPAGCHQGPVIKLEGNKATCTKNQNAWGSRTAQCWAYYKPKCDTEVAGFNSAVEQNKPTLRSEPLVPIVVGEVDGEDQAWREGTPESGYYRPYPLLGSMKPNVGLTVFEEFNQRSSFVTSTMSPMISVLRQADPTRLAKVASGETFNPSWLNNASVNSCAEYVYKRFFGYRRYTDAARALGDNWEAAFQLAYKPVWSQSQAAQRQRGHQPLE